MKGVITIKDIFLFLFFLSFLPALNQQEILTRIYLSGRRKLGRRNGYGPG
jgi:hypothetical protein